MKRFLVSPQGRLALVTSGLLAASTSHAAVDTSALVTEISSNEAAIVAVGAALLALAVVAVGIKWIKGTIFS